MKFVLKMVIIGLLIPLLIASKNVFAEENSIELAEQAKSAVLIEQDTGAVLYAKNSQEALPPASMTKIMTMLLIMEALEDGKIKLEEKVRTSDHAASMGGSQIFLEEGEEMTVEQLLQAIAIASANDASVALAERIAGSEEAFVKMMNNKVKQLGLKNTKFQNSTGLPAKEHYSSAEDMAVLGRELLKYENITKYTGQYETYLREDTDKKFWLVNTNRLVRFYPGADGLKTGFTNEAKYCLTATAKRDGMRVIAVIFGAPTTKDRNRQISKMFDYAFNQYEVHPLYKKGDKVGETVVQKGESRKLSAVTDDNVSLLMKKGETMDGFKKKITFNKNIKAPIMKGDAIGKLTITKNGNTITEKTIVAENDVSPATLWTMYKRSFSEFTKIK